MKFKSALCLQGGAMRGVFTAGVLDAFIDNDIEFSDVYGISSGSKAMQYYPSKQRGYSYMSDIEASKCENMFNMGNLILGLPVIDMDYYIKEIRNKKFPLDYKSVLESYTKLHIGCTNINTGKIEYFPSNDPNFLEALVASCSLPVLQPIVKIRDNEYLDGGLSETIPFKTAFNEGFDKVVSVSTRHKGYRAIENHTFDFAYSMKYANYPNLLSLLKNMHTKENEYYTELEKLESEGKMIVIRPSYEVDVDRLERDQNKLKRLYEDGYNQGLIAIKQFIDYFK